MSPMRPINDPFIRSAALKLRDEKRLLGLGIKLAHQFTRTAILSERNSQEPFAGQYLEPGFGGRLDPPDRTRDECHRWSPSLYEGA